MMDDDTRLQAAKQEVRICRDCKAVIIWEVDVWTADSDGDGRECPAEKSWSRYIKGEEYVATPGHFRTHRIKHPHNPVMPEPFKVTKQVPVDFVVVEGIEIPASTLVAYSYSDDPYGEYDPDNTYLSPDAERALIDTGLVKKRTRGSCYGTEKLKALMLEMGLR